MITKERIVEYLTDVYGDLDSDECGIVRDKYGLVLTMEQAIDTLDDLNVEYPRERVEWYNCTTLDIEEVAAVANVQFRVLTCENCGEKEYEGEPEDWGQFQGVYGNDGHVGYYSGNINGNNIDTYLCGKCVPIQFL